MITKICEQCGKEYKVRPSQVDKRRFCSRECMGKWRSEYQTGENNPAWNGGGKIIKTCEQCGEEYEIRSSVRGQRFCSHECFGKWKSDNVRGENNHAWKGGKIIKTCKQCGEEYETHPSRKNRSNFCSKKCLYKWRSGKNHPSWKGGNVVKICEQCGGEYKTQQSWADKRRFCSEECMGKWHSGENNPMWKNGASFEPYCHKFNEAFKESIREKFGRICFLCPTTEEENGRKLSVHHTNYNKDCLCDDSECEFVPLCTKCHSKTNFNRDYWENMIMEKLEVIQCT